MIKLEQAIRKMKHGDRFVFSIAGMNPLFCNGENDFSWKEIHGARFNLFEYLSHCEASGEIIRADPKVLTAEKWIDGLITKKGLTCETLNWINFSFCEGDKNGQTKEWKRLKPLIDALRGQAVAYARKHQKPHPELVELLENLTPPWEIDKND